MVLAGAPLRVIKRAFRLPLGQSRAISSITLSLRSGLAKPLGPMLHVSSQCRLSSWIRVSRLAIQACRPGTVAGSGPNFSFAVSPSDVLGGAFLGPAVHKSTEVP